MIFCQKNFLIDGELMFVIGFASTHLVKYSTATIAKVKLSCAGVNLLTMSMPHRCWGQDGTISYTSCARTFDLHDNF
jgi:hypothetical protein